MTTSAVSAGDAGWRAGVVSVVSPPVRIGVAISALERIRPRLIELAELIPELSQSAASLGQSVAPLSDLVNRLPGARRRQLGVFP